MRYAGNQARAVFTIGGLQYAGNQARAVFTIGYLQYASNQAEDMALVDTTPEDTGTIPKTTAPAISGHFRQA